MSSSQDQDKKLHRKSSSNSIWSKKQQDSSTEELYTSYLSHHGYQQHNETSGSGDDEDDSATGIFNTNNNESTSLHQAFGKMKIGTSYGGGGGGSGAGGAGDWFDFGEPGGIPEFDPEPYLRMGPMSAGGGSHAIADKYIDKDLSSYKKFMSHSNQPSRRPKLATTATYRSNKSTTKSNGPKATSSNVSLPSRHSSSFGGGSGGGAKIHPLNARLPTTKLGFGVSSKPIYPACVAHDEINKFVLLEVLSTVKESAPLRGISFPKLVTLSRPNLQIPINSTLENTVHKTLEELVNCGKVSMYPGSGGPNDWTFRLWSPSSGAKSDLMVKGSTIIPPPEQNNKQQKGSSSSSSGFLGGGQRKTNYNLGGGKGKGGGGGSSKFVDPFDRIKDEHQARIGREVNAKLKAFSAMRSQSRINYLSPKKVQLFKKPGVTTKKEEARHEPQQQQQRHRHQLQQQQKQNQYQTLQHEQQSLKLPRQTKLQQQQQLSQFWEEHTRGSQSLQVDSSDDDEPEADKHHPINKDSRDRDLTSYHYSTDPRITKSFGERAAALLGNNNNAEQRPNSPNTPKDPPATPAPPAQNLPRTTRHTPTTEEERRATLAEYYDVKSLKPFEFEDDDSDEDESDDYDEDDEDTEDREKSKIPQINNKRN